MTSVNGLPAAREQVLNSSSTDSEFLLACASAASPGTAVLGLGYNVNLDSINEDVNSIISTAKEANGGDPLNTLIIQDMSGRGLQIDTVSTIASFVEDGDIAEGGTIAFMDPMGGTPEQYQQAADETGLTVVVDENGYEPGVTVYRSGQEAEFDADGSISNGGLGSRGCGTPAGYDDGSNGPA